MEAALLVANLMGHIGPVQKGLTNTPETMETRMLKPMHAPFPIQVIRAHMI